MRNRRMSLYRHRQRQKYNDSVSSYAGGISLAEFKFYNKAKNIIEEDIIKKIENKIKKGKENIIHWTNNTFAEHGIGFRFNSEIITEDEKERTEVFIKIIEMNDISFSPKQFNDSKYIYFNRLFIHFAITEQQRTFLNKLYFDSSKMAKMKKFVAKNWSELIDNLIKSGILTQLERTYMYHDYKRDAKLMFGDAVVLPDTLSRINEEKKGYVGYDKVFHILKVLEKRIKNVNYRIAFVRQPDGHDTYYSVIVVDENNIEYNYIDEDRVYFIAHDIKYFLDDGLKEYRNDQLHINMNLFKSMSRNISQILSENERVVTAPIYRFYKERAMRFLGDDDDHDEDIDSKEMKIREQYKKLLAEGKEVKTQNTLIGKNKIEVIGEVFKIEFDPIFLNVHKKFDSIRRLLNDNDVRYNFNVLYEKILKLSQLKIIDMHNTQYKDYKNFQGCSFKVNSMEINVTKDNNRIKINDVFCRISDVFHILSKVICYHDVNEFNKYVKEVSYIGIEWKKMISNGVALEISNPFYTIFKKTGDASFERMLLRFSLLWDAEKRNKVYLMLNNTKYPIKYKGKFKTRFNYPRRAISMSQLKKELNECIEDVTDDAIVEIVENAVEEAKIIQKRGEELVQNTIRDVKAKEMVVDIRGNMINGYFIVGRVSGSEYFIEKVQLDVYKKVDGIWNRRCVVDDHTKQRIFEDKVANRLVNIYNEPKKIFTLHNT